MASSYFYEIEFKGFADLFEVERRFSSIGNSLDYWQSEMSGVLYEEINEGGRMNGQPEVWRDVSCTPARANVCSALCTNKERNFSQFITQLGDSL